MGGVFYASPASEWMDIMQSEATRTNRENKESLNHRVFLALRVSHGRTLGTCDLAHIPRVLFSGFKRPVSASLHGTVWVGPSLFHRCIQSIRSHTDSVIIQVRS